MCSLQLSIVEFFSSSENFSQLKKIIDNRFIQPRLIDFYVTQYAKNNPEFFILRVDGKAYGLMDVYSSYKLQLKAFHKKWFNLFDKKKNIVVGIDLYIEMSIARLNVYKWLIDNSIAGLLTKNLYEIQSKYYDFRKASMRDKQTNQKKRGRMSTFIKNPLIMKGIKKHLEKI